MSDQTQDRDRRLAGVFQQVSQALVSNLDLQDLLGAVVDQAMAVLDGRIHISCNDIRHAAIPVLRHRIAPNFQAQAEGMNSEKLIERLVQTVPEPNIPKYE